MKLFVIIEEQGEHVFAMLVREALTQAAEEQGIDLETTIHLQGGNLAVPVAKTPQDVLLLVGMAEKTAHNEAASFGGRIVTVTRQQMLDGPKALLQGLWTEDAAQADTNGQSAQPLHKIVAITSCPTGIAHTFMAAEALSESAKKLGLEIRVETQGSVGAGTPLTAAEIAAADVVIIAADREVDRSRFNGKRVYASSTKAAIHDGSALIRTAEQQAKLQSGGQAAADETAGDHKTAGAFNLYRHLMTGISFMLPFVVAGGLLIALGFALGGENVDQAVGTFAHVLFTIGGYGLGLMVAVLAGYIAYSIADRPGIAPGMIGGYLAVQINAGFLGGILAGFLAGYVVLGLIRVIHLPRNLQGLMPVLVLPLLATLITGLLMAYVLGPPVAIILEGLKHWLMNIQGANAALVGLLIGGMMAIDMGGPINKAAYATATSLIGEGIVTPMAAAMLGGMVPPIALAVATMVFPSRFTAEERNSKAATFILGLSFISEGAIPFAARNPLRVIPAIAIGAAVAGAISMATGTGLRAPHGGIFVAPIATNYTGYALALVCGVIVSTICLGIFCKRLEPGKNAA